MGGGSYSDDNSMRRRVDKGWASDNLVRSRNLAVPDNYRTKTTAETFEQRQMHQDMNPHGVMLRESRDSAEHPESLAILIAMDETGSMGIVPDHLVKEGLPHLMNAVYKAGIQHPQVLFAGIGDHKCDRAPIQIGQYETSDELLDKWLTATFLEGGGGGNGGESYALAWYFAGFRTALDCHEKRGQKGVLITIGDEACHPSYDGEALRSIFGGKAEFRTMSSQEMLAAAREKYHVFHVLIRETQEGHRQKTHDGWKELMGDNLLIADTYQDVPKLITDAVLRVATKRATVTEKKETPAAPVAPDAPKKQEEML